MYYLTEDPIPLMAGLGLAALVLLVALKVTQQGKYLVWAGVLAAIAAGVFGFERYWVTDAERIESVVYDLADAIESSDVDRIKSHLDEQVSLNAKGHAGNATGVLWVVLPLLKRTHFDFVRIGRLNTSAMDQARRGSAEFTIAASGVFDEAGSRLPVAAAGTEWSLGFREVSPGVWKVNRVTPIKLPGDVARYLGLGR